MAAQNEKPLLVSRRIVLVVFVDGDITCPVGAPRGNPEGPDAEVVSDRPIVDLASAPGRRQCPAEWLEPPIGIV
jgi:hypothetical protein